MAYRLGVDLGTTFVAAAIAYESQIEMVTLGDRSVVTPAVVYLREDNAVVTGEAAHRRASSSPDRVVREFKRRLGDPTPVILAGAPHAVTDLLGAVLRDVLAKVSQTEGEPPERVVLTHPANWGPYRRGLFEEVPRLAGLTDTQTITEPEAAATHYAATRKLNEGDTVAVYDLGGGTFDVTVLRKQGDGIEILGTPEGIERLGGIDFDEAVLSHINFASDGALAELDIRDPQNAVALARLRQDCVLAKESLSVDTETLIPVFLPGRNFDVWITREEFEKLVRAQVESTVGALSRTLRSARVEPDELSAVLLVGGSSRIPLVARMVSEELGRPIVVDTHPKYAVALGAATTAAMAPGESSTQPPRPPLPRPPTPPLPTPSPPKPSPPKPPPPTPSLPKPPLAKPAPPKPPAKPAPPKPPPARPPAEPEQPSRALQQLQPPVPPPRFAAPPAPAPAPFALQPPPSAPPPDQQTPQPTYQAAPYQPPGGALGYQQPGPGGSDRPDQGQYSVQYPGQQFDQGQYPGQYPGQQWHQGPPQGPPGGGSASSLARTLASVVALVVLAIVVAYLTFTVVGKLRGLG